MKNIIRCFIAAWYLLGWMVHVYLVFNSPEIYAVFGNTSIFPGFELIWVNLIMPNIMLFACLLAAFELATGLLLVNKNDKVKIGLLISIIFNLFLVQMGLGLTTPDFLMDFLSNRLPNIIFIMIQLPLFWGKYPKTIVEEIRIRAKAIK
ncbi:MAG: hypothetical protein JEZ00_12955 [Anaerolineaceae bacterium]|nr:hypothetical protein [Anaerolineaceae bacterium]